MVASPTTLAMPTTGGRTGKTPVNSLHADLAYGQRERVRRRKILTWLKFRLECLFRHLLSVAVKQP